MSSIPVISVDKLNPGDRSAARIVDAAVGKMNYYQSFLPMNHRCAM